MTEMLSAPSQVVIGTLLYTVKFEELNDDLVDRRARALIEEPLVDLTPTDEHQAIVDALWSSATLTEVIRLPTFMPELHGEQEFRDFLRRLLERLDTMRPWPEPLHRELNASRWSHYEATRIVGRIKMRSVDAQERINYAFGGVEVDGGKLHLVILQLKSGDEVALVAPWWQHSKDVAILSRDLQRPPEEVLGAFLDATRFTSEEVERLHQDNPAEGSSNNSS